MRLTHDLYIIIIISQTTPGTVPSPATESGQAAVQALLDKAFIGYMTINFMDPGVEFSTPQPPGNRMLDAVRQQALMVKMVNDGVKPFEHPFNVWSKRTEITNLGQASTVCHAGVSQATWASRGTDSYKPCALSGRIRSKVVATFRSTLMDDIIPVQEKCVKTLEEDEENGQLVNRQDLSDARALLASRQAQLTLYQHWPIRLYDRGTPESPTPAYSAALICPTFP